MYGRIKSFPLQGSNFRQVSNDYIMLVQNETEIINLV